MSRRYALALAVSMPLLLGFNCDHGSSHTKVKRNAAVMHPCDPPPGVNQILDDDISPGIPEPSSVVMFGFGLATLILATKKR